jgi:crossover junction endodeoxyribonuclease RusA
MTQRTVSVEQARELAKSQRGKAWGERRKTEKEAQAERRDRYRVTTEPVTVRLPLPPPLNSYYGINIVGRSIKEAFPVRHISTEGKAFREEVIRIWEKLGVTFEGRLAIKARIVWPDRRAYDLDGRWKALLDALEHAGAYEDDSQIKAESMEEVAIEAPGWVTITLGPKLGERQGTLFDTEW